MERSSAILRALQDAPSARDRPVARADRACSSPSSATRSGGCRRSSMSPAPTAKAPPPRSCGRCSRPPATASTSTPRRTSSASTSASASAARAAAVSSTRMTLVDALLEVEQRQRRRADHRSSRSPPPPPSVLFADHPADFTLLEVGLGGRFDATNIVDDAARGGDHLDLDGPREILRQHARRDRRARRPASSSAAVRSSSPRRPAEVHGRDRARMRRGSARRSFAGNRDWVAYAERGRLVYPGRGRPPRPAEPAACRPAPVRQCRHRHRRCIRRGCLPDPHGGDRGRAAQRRLAGAPAAADRRRPRRPRPSGCRALARRRPQSRRRPGHRRGHGRPRGTRPAAALSSSRACSPPRTRSASSVPSPGWCARSITVPVPSSNAGRDPAELAEFARSAGMLAEPVADVAHGARPDRRRPAGARVRRASSSSARSTSPAPCSPPTGRHRRRVGKAKRAHRWR